MKRLNLFEGGPSLFRFPYLILFPFSMHYINPVFVFLHQFSPKSDYFYQNLSMLVILLPKVLLCPNMFVLYFKTTRCYYSEFVLYFIF